MSFPATTVPMSPEEFLEWEERQKNKHEFIGGEIFAMVGVTRQHATIAGNLFRFLGNHLSGSPCRVYMADMKLKLDLADAFFYPDVFVTCSESDHKAERYMSEPRLIVEVLSESTEAYDRGEKFANYRKFASLTEYALIDPVARMAEIFRRDDTGHWVLYEFSENEQVHFSSVDLVIDQASLFENAD
ncbi:Uma2 family endonuclease [Methylotuvimicrobium sp. KM2]|uniref:Uma2 family endonuclease n=1 Tax=Methylotuvimicrobium sp. KM2 TaxID=3133976 RepID=UPI0031015400